MDISGVFWATLILMTVAAVGFIALPLLRNNRKYALLAIAVAVPLLAAGLYMNLGAPESGDSHQRQSPAKSPVAATTGDSGASGDSKIGSVASMVDGLAVRLREDPNDGGNWLLLARSYKHLNRTDEAIDAYARAAELGQFDAGLAELSDTSVSSHGSGAQISGNVTLSPAATNIVEPTDTVFIFAKALNGPPAPLAVLQRKASELPIDFLLNDSQAMVAGMKLSDFDEVVVTARITRGGDATVALQGLEAKSDTVLVAENRRLNLIIE